MSLIIKDVGVVYLAVGFLATDSTEEDLHLSLSEASQNVYILMVRYPLLGDLSSIYSLKLSGISSGFELWIDKGTEN